VNQMKHILYILFNFNSHDNSIFVNTKSENSQILLNYIGLNNFILLVKNALWY